MEPYRIATYYGFRFFLTIVDDKVRMIDYFTKIQEWCVCCDEIFSYIG